METAAQSFAAYSQINQLSHSTATSNQLHASMDTSSWHHTHLSVDSTALTPGQSPSMFSVTNRSPDLEYPSPAPSNASPPYSQQQQTEQYGAQHQSPPLHLNSPNDIMLGQFSQVESRIGPSRVLTRRQRAALEQNGIGRRASMPSNFQRPEQAPSPVRPIVSLYFGTS